MAISPQDWPGIPAEALKLLDPHVGPDERPSALLQTDLDARMQFRSEWVVVTDCQVLTVRPVASTAMAPRGPAIDLAHLADADVDADADADADAGAGAKRSDRPARADWHCEAWSLRTGMALRSTESSGLGLLELHGSDGRLATWRYTTDRASVVQTLVRAFRRNLPRAATLGGGGEAGPSVCPRCGGLLGDDGECKACSPTLQPPPTRALYRLGQFASNQRGLLVLGGVLMLASTIAGLLPPYIIGPFYENVLEPLGDGSSVATGLVTWYLGWLFGAAIVAWLLGWARNYVMYLASERISADLRRRTYEHLQKLSLEFFGGQRTGDLISRVSSDTDRICSFLSADALDFLTDVLLILFTAAILFWIHPLLAFVTLVPLFPVAWLVQRLRDSLRRGFARGTTAWADMVAVLADTIPGIRVVKAFAQESREVERFDQANQYVLEANNRVNRMWSFFGPLVVFVTEIGGLIIWAFGVWLLARGEVEIKVLLVFVAYIGRFYSRLESMSRVLASVQRAGAAAHRIFEILDRSPSVPEPARPVDPGRIAGRVELRDVRFRYGKREVLHGLNVAIEPGEMIGLVGPSGAGKSTLVNLVCRFYDVSQGAILVDGRDIREFGVEAYRRNIGIVLQEPFLFYGTIADNIAYGRPDASRADIVAAARAAHAHEFILRLTDGYDSLVGERGQALSGGERQRISIARALLTDPRILILDEATSSVDTETEREIQAALDTLVQGRTTIAIAHRLSTLRKANRLVVVEAGRIVEVGPHDELVSRGGTYSRLHRAQVELARQIGI